MSYLYEIRDLRCSYDKNYREGISKVVLEVRNLNIPGGKMVFIVGESGIGKSTILETLGLMNNTMVPDSRTMLTFCSGGNDSVVDLTQIWSDNNYKLLSDVRLKHFSFIFQSTNLMRNFSAYENVAFTRMLQGYDKESCFEKAREIMAGLGLEHVDENRMAQELSGGQQQRLAFVRDILPDFTVLFGDEPTGNLDSENAIRVMNVLSDKLAKSESASALIVSHDMHLAISYADMIIKIRKEARPKNHEYDEDIAFGVVDDDCVFVADRSGDKRIWSNGKDTYQDSEFELFLKTKTFD